MIGAINIIENDRSDNRVFGYLEHMINRTYDRLKSLLLPIQDKKSL